MNEAKNTSDLPLPLMARLVESIALRPFPAAIPAPTPAFLQQARLAALRAADIRRLRQGVSDIGFAALPLPDYLSEAAHRTGASLARLLPSRSGLLDGWIALAKETLVPLKRIQLMVRAFVATRQSAPASVVMARGHREATPHFSGTTGEDSFDRALTALEATYNPAAREELRALLEKVNP